MKGKGLAGVECEFSPQDKNEERETETGGEGEEIGRKREGERV